MSGVTANLKLVGGDGPASGQPRISEAQGLHSFGSEASAVLALPGADHELGAGLTEAMVRFAARNEYARTAEDVLARRWRLLFLDARLAAPLAPGRWRHPGPGDGGRSPGSPRSSSSRGCTSPCRPETQAG